MNESRVRSPEQNLKRSQILASPSHSKSKAYLPSRYAQQRRIQKAGFHDILNSIESKVQGQVVKNKGENSPKAKITISRPETKQGPRKLKTSQFKSRPLKREKSDEINFNQIFLNPREEALEELKKKTVLQDNIKTISHEYQKLLNIDEGKQNLADNLLERPSSPTPKHSQNCKQDIQMLQSGDAFGLNIQTTENDFYDNQISIQPPDVPANNMQNPGIGTPQAPSIPSNYKAYKSLNLKQLLMRARAGMNGDDVEKQAHLSYFLGEVYTEKRMYVEALKFHRRYLGFAKSMEDLIGMGVGANRVATGYYNCGEIQKSIIFHNENLKLSNNDNCFAGFYNIGICYRKLKKNDQALEYFQSALNWAQEKGEEESECIALGQIGATFQAKQMYQEAIEKFESSIQICNKIKKQDLKLHNLRYILRICSMLQLKPLQHIQEVVEQAFVCAQAIDGRSMLDIFRCNIGIVRGIQEMNNLNDYQDAQQIEQIS